MHTALRHQRVRPPCPALRWISAARNESVPGNMSSTKLNIMNTTGEDTVPLDLPEHYPSIVHGPSEVPLLDFKLAELLDFQCERYGSQECLIIPWTGARWTYDFLRQESICLARALAVRGVRPGDRVGIMAGNCEQYTAVFFACMRLGAVLVILNNTYTASEALYALKFTECKMLFTTPWIGRHDNRGLLSHLASNPGTLEEIVILRGFATLFTSYNNLAEQGSILTSQQVDAYQSEFSDHDVCNLQFTSGTTGTPKAAMLTHHSLVNNARFIGDRMSLTPDDVLCCPPPLFHCFGLVLGMLATVSHGGKIVYPSETFDAAACLQAVSDEACTALHGVPAMFDSIFSLPRPEYFDTLNLRTGIIAGAPVPKQLMELLVHELGMTEFTSSYGLTEASPTVFNSLTTTPLHLKLSTVGTVMPHCHAKVVDREHNIVPLGDRGELCVAGYQLQAGYWNNRSKTDEVMIRDSDGVTWLHTGDEAFFSVAEDGNVRCSITGRFKDIVIRGGENIYPLEIEERLSQHPGIEQAIVVGVKHARLGEVVAAFLSQQHTDSSGRQTSQQQPRYGDADIQAFVKQTLGRHKAPEHIFWLGEDGVPADVPLTGSGKVRKFEMRELAERMLRERGRDGRKL